MTESRSLIETLKWLDEMGVDAPVMDVPQNKFQAPPKAPLLPVSQISSQESPKMGLQDVTTLEGLKAVMSTFEGCSIKETAMNLVFSDGNPAAPIMVVGEAPGADEDRLGKPFVGLSGQLLDKVFGSAGWSRAKELYITNVVPWRPPGNRQPSTQEIALCVPFLKKHIELIRPKVIICAGSISAKALLETADGITKIHGRFFKLQISEGIEVIVMPIYHPAFLLRSPSRKKDVWFDVLRLKEKMASGAF